MRRTWKDLAAAGAVLPLLSSPVRLAQRDRLSRTHRPAAWQALSNRTPVGPRYRCLGADDGHQPLLRAVSLMAIFLFVRQWDDFFVRFVLVLDPDKQPASVSMYPFFSSYDGLARGQLAAFSLMQTLSIVFPYAITSRFLGRIQIPSGSEADHSHLPTEGGLHAHRRHEQRRARCS